MTTSRLSADLLIQTIDQLSLPQQNKLVTLLQQRGLADDAAAMSDKTDQITLQAIAQAVWDCLDDVASLPAYH